MKMKRSEIFKKTVSAVLAACVIFALSACGASASGNTDDSSGSSSGSSSSDQSSVSFDAMDTYMTITVYGDNAEEAAEMAQAEIERLDGILSAESESSEIYKINAAGGGTLSDDAAYLVDVSLKLWEDTDGAFDISIYPVAALWGFTTGDYAVPSDEDLAEALSCVGSDMLSWDAENSVLALGEGMAIGLGGIAKGYSGDQISEIFESCGVTGAIASLGGNIVVYGSKPSGESWKVAIQDPADSSGYACILSLDGSANIITSGGYERYFEEDGVTYHHIIDPDTGCPASSGLASVSIITTNGTEGDGLSTALFVMGLEEAIEFWQTDNEYDFEMVLIDTDGNLYISEGLADSCSSDFDVTVISRQ